MTFSSMVLLCALWSVRMVCSFRSPILRSRGRLYSRPTLSSIQTTPAYNRHRLYSTSTDESSLSDLVEKINSQGNHVRELKASKADKDLVKAAVDELLALKANYKSITGNEYGKESKTEESKAVAERPSEVKVASSIKSPVKENKPLKEEAKEVTLSLDEIRQVRLDKVQTMRENNINPFAYTFQQTHKAMALQEMYKDLANGEEKSDAIVSVAGRIMVIFINTLAHLQYIDID